MTAEVEKTLMGSGQKVNWPWQVVLVSKTFVF